MRLLLLLGILTSTLYGNDFIWSQNEMGTLKISYEKYIANIIKVSKNADKIMDLDCQLAEHKPIVTNITFSDGYTLRLAPLDFFEKINPLGAYDPMEINAIDKQFIAQLDLIKVNAYTFMLNNLSTFYNSLGKKGQDKEILYKELFKRSESKLLSLAQMALKSPSQDAELLSSEFNLIIQQLSAIPFPPEYSFYRRRMAYSLDTPIAAQQEIDRIQKSLNQLK